MSDPDLTVRNYRDYKRIEKLRDDLWDTLDKQARAEDWNHDRFVTELTKADLPYFLALTDLSNPRIAEYALRDTLNDKEYSSTLFDPADDPALATQISSATALLNATYEQSFAPPPIVLSKGMFASSGSPLSYDPIADAVFIDRDFYKEYRNDPQALAGLVGHELGHRYQRSPEQLAMQLEVLSGSTDPVKLAAYRAMEAKVDFHGAQIATPQAMRRGLDASVSENFEFPLAQAAAYFRSNDPELSIDDAQFRYHMLNEKDQRTLMKEIESLPAETRKTMMGAFAHDLLTEFAAEEAKRNHPSYQNRDDMLKLLEANPDLLRTPGLCFTGSADIVTATEHGPANCPNVAPSPGAGVSPK